LIGIAKIREYSFIYEIFSKFFLRGLDLQQMYQLSLWTMVVLYVAAGINHFVCPVMYVSIMPHFLPAASYRPLVAVSGICEVVFGLLLIPSLTRPAAAWLIIALLIAIFPANIQMTVDFTRRHNPYVWVTWLRLPLQVVLIWWAYKFTGPGPH
jgi:uncharacterized membrane protein